MLKNINLQAGLLSVLCPHKNSMPLRKALKKFVDEIPVEERKFAYLGSQKLIITRRGEVGVGRPRAATPGNDVRDVWRF